MIRRRAPARAETVAAVVAAATAGISAAIAAGQVYVAIAAEPEIAGLIALIDKPDHRAPGVRAALGRVPIAFAEAQARRRGFAELRLYTHATMVGNIALYRRLGFTETGRGLEDGYDRVFMVKRG